MGRTSIPNINISFSRDLYNSCWRNIQVDTQYGVGGSPTNLSLCKFLDYQQFPYITRTNKDSNNNYSINGYWNERGYFWYLKLVNTTNNTIRFDNPNSPSSGYSSPFSPQSTSSSTGAIMMNGGLVTGAAPLYGLDTYVRIRATPSSGYTWSGWYTASSGGSLITSSSDYNAYYNFTTVINNNIWYARNTASPVSRSGLLWYDTTETDACFSGGPSGFFWIAGSGPNFAPNWSTVSGPLYSNSSLSTFAPNSYYSNLTVVRYVGPNGSIGSSALCPGGPGGPGGGGSE